MFSRNNERYTPRVAMQTRAEFYRSLPAKRMASAVLLFNEQNQVLVV